MPLLRSLFSLLLSLLLGGVLLGAAGLGLYMVYLDGVIRTEFDRKRWALPAKVYARPLELFSGMPLSADAFAQELKLLRYRDVNCPVEPPAAPAESGKRSIKRKPKPPAPETCVPPPGGGDSPSKPGSYARQGETFELVTRDGFEVAPERPARKDRVKDHVSGIEPDCARRSLPRRHGKLRSQPQLELAFPDIGRRAAGLERRMGGGEDAVGGGITLSGRKHRIDLPGLGKPLSLAIQCSRESGLDRRV